MNVGDLVVLKEDKRELYDIKQGLDLGPGVVLDEFVTASGDLLFEVYWSLGVREWIRPSWLKLVKRNSGAGPMEGI